MLKNSLKKIIIALLMSLMIPILSFSENISNNNQNEDSLIWITAKQLKQTNIIFLEHKKLLQRDSILSQQVLNLEQVYINYNKIDSLRQEQLLIAQQQIKADSIKMVAMDKKIKKSKRKIKNRNYTLIGFSGLTFLLGYLLISK